MKRSEDRGSVGDAEMETNSGERGGKEIRIKRNPESYCKYKYCPVKGCKCKQPLKKLSIAITSPQQPTR